VQERSLAERKLGWRWLVHAATTWSRRAVRRAALGATAEMRPSGAGCVVLLRLSGRWVGMKAKGWLCRDEAERARLLDMSARLKPAKRLSIALLGVAAIVSVPVYGWAMQIPFIAAGVAVAVGELVMARIRRPEYSSVAVWLFAQVSIVAAIGLAAGPRIYALPILVFPVLVAAPQLPPRVVAAGTALSVAAMVGTAFVFMPDAVAATPPALVLPVALLIVLAVLAGATLDAERQSREAAVVDPLTGLLNRTALQARAAELSHHLAGIDSAEVTVIVGDVDHLKAINDEHGHATGDEVLVAVARRLDTAVAQNGSLYRFGGEEFVVLLEGAEAGVAAAGLAERMRAAAHHKTPAGLPVTMSFGLATSNAAVRDYALLFASADRALYRAKAAGRDCVRTSDPRDLAGASVRTMEQDDASPDRRLRRATPLAGAGATAFAARTAAREDRSPDAPRSLLIRTATEREHMLDMFARLTRVSMVTNPIAFAALVSTIPWFGWRSIVPVVVSVIVAQATNTFVAPRVARPEYPMTLTVVLVLVGTGLALLVAHPAPLFALPFLAVLMFVTAAALPARGAAGVAVFSGAVMAAVALLMGAHQVLSNPSILTLPLALLGAISFFGYGIGQATVDQLGVATTDQLTGMLNRAALHARVAELSHRLATGGEPVALLIADLDCFKAINDEHGHAAGDRVLAEAAERMRADLRLFDSVYRIGGEEFVVILVGMDERGAAAVGERIRTSIRQRHVAGLPVTVSVGVAACVAGEAFDYEQLFKTADAALRAAKEAGRDQVAVASAAPAATLVAA